MGNVRSSFSIASHRGPHSRRRRTAGARPGFTLTELMVVIGIIVLLLGLALPAFNAISGSRSIDGAENQLSALLGRARAEAIGLQRVEGVFFYLDPVSQRVSAALVYATAAKYNGTTLLDNTNVDVYLDLVSDRDNVALPAGVMLQVIDNSSVTSSVRADDGYIGYNVPTGGTTSSIYGGVILFDSSGQLASLKYGFRNANLTSASAAVNTTITDMGTLLGFTTAGTIDFAPGMTSQYGIVLFNRSAFTDQKFTLGDPQIDSTIDGGAYATNERAEETWIDSNSTPLLVNRYNGTLVRGE